MNFNKNSEIRGRHSLMSASKYHWLRYDDDQVIKMFFSATAAQRGTELHAFAAEAIRLGIKLPRSQKTMNSFVNESIGFQMTPEQPLFVSVNCFGTPDAIGHKKNILRISDLKTGVSAASMDQLKIYAAMYCLEYGEKPAYLVIELRIYQNDEVILEVADPMEITEVMDRIQYVDKMIEKLKEQEEV